ncbi:oligopeptide ABC transporter permease [Fervidibacillus halotolerans]|uniref:ABC transporter permease n=1 Tax=Fervidibacillus halotolerans TaxID=2980027 RepID=A0A9E8LXY1_9BACI|nr:oligopeptide ABC transporter permease [Fervidibacillus halotolerans]WAA11783.1 ABC transporter permease [Fervidibacillus halotolerans]
MLKFIVRRLLIMIPQLLLLSIIIFLLAKAMPGDALTGQMVANPNLDPETMEELREKLGLNDPWHEQYIRWIGNLLQGDFGISYVHNVKISDLLGNRMANTFLLGLLTLIFAYLIAIPLGIIAGRYPDSWMDKLIVGYNFVSYAIPLFVFALLMLFLFGYTLNWFPTGGSVDVQVERGTWDWYLSKLHHLILPSISAALLSTVGTIQYLRSEIIDTKLKDFVKTAKAKGTPERKVYTRHIFRNSLLPVAAFLGYDIVFILGGSIFIEQIFNYPGLGQLFVSSISQRDFSVVNILVMLFGFLSILGTLLSDIILSIVDPRIRID